ncbi:hypothetical protein [Thiothrix subterranea]|uniref:hypothetical protein n=1 Tax=Thiothrix subterranea TaxID=2735563 RepID=UPI00280A5581|nr:hypothetical protein [Thiothrix subterranea]
MLRVAVFRVPFGGAHQLDVVATACAQTCHHATDGMRHPVDFWRPRFRDDAQVSVVADKLKAGV